MNFLAAHECGVGFREFRDAGPSTGDTSTGEPAFPDKTDSVEFAGETSSRPQ
jgi:hypothetical protein